MDTRLRIVKTWKKEPGILRHTHGQNEEKSDNPKHRQGYEKVEILIHWQFLKKVKMHLHCDPTIPSLGIYPKETKTCVSAKSCARLFLVLFAMVKNQKQLNGDSSMDK